MIDKYKRPRVQRIPAWRAPAPAHREGYASTAEMVRDTVHFYHLTVAMVDAEVSGAMPGDFVRQELRVPAQ